MRSIATPFAALWLRFLRYPWSRLRRATFERRWADAPLPAAMSPGYRPLLVTAVTWPLAQSHTVCAFRDLEDGSWRAFDNARLLEDRFASVDDVARHIAQRGERVLCWDVVEPRGLRRLRWSRTL
jgi:hypothetical protein